MVCADHKLPMLDISATQTINFLFEESAVSEESEIFIPECTCSIDV